MVRLQLRSRNEIEHIIQDRLNQDCTETVLPIWRNRTDVSGKIIDIPIDCLVMRVKNTRTKDLQRGAVRKGQPILSGEDVLPAPVEGTFDEINQWELLTQNYQSVLLLREANKKRGGKSLVEKIQDEQWSNGDRPIITQQGVLINGNTRLAALEYLIRESPDALGPSISIENPSIEVIVIPDREALEGDIKQLEKKLQARIVDVLYYDWIQVTTEILDEEIDIADAAALSAAVDSYKQYPGFQNAKEIEHKVEMRMLADELLNRLGLPDQTFEISPPEFLMDEMVKRKKNLLKLSEPANRATEEQKILAAYSIMLRLSLDGLAKGEMRYQVSRMQQTPDSDEMLDAVNSTVPGLIVQAMNESGFDEVETYELNLDAYGRLTDDERGNIAHSISDAAEEMHIRNKEINNERLVIERLKDAIKHLKNSRKYLTNGKDLPIEADVVELFTQLTTLMHEYHTDLRRLYELG